MNEQYWNPELETMPWPQVQGWQASRLAAFVGGLPARSRFYADKLAGLAPAALTPESLAELAALPMTGKDELRLAQSEPRPGEPFGAIQAAPLADIVQALSSSGTTGQATVYGLTRRDSENWSDAIANMFFTAGIRRGDVIAHLVGLPMVAGGLPYADGFRRIGATLAWLGGFPPERILAMLPRLQVNALLATTSFGVYLADHCASIAGVEASALGVRKYVSGGEPGLAQPEIRGRIETGFGTRHVRETMGLGDVLAGMWAECEVGHGMHFNAQRYVAVELIDPDTGETVEWRDGALGEAVYTTFDREATPLLRYRSRDHLRVVGMGCACGRTSPRVQCVGRTDDMLIYKGMNVFPTAIREVVLGQLGSLASPFLRVLKDEAKQVRFDRPIEVEVEPAVAGAIGNGGASGNAEATGNFGVTVTTGATAASDAIAADAPLRDAEQAVRQRLQVRVTIRWVAPGSLPRSAYKTPLVQARGAVST